LKQRATALLKPFGDEAAPVFDQPASRFAAGDDTVHFGYRDNISQPRIEGVDYKYDSSVPGRIPVGDVLLGPDYRTSRGNLPIADLPVDLAKNGTYAALRVIEQHVKNFNEMLAKPVIKPPLPSTLREDQAAGLIAAKLLGRWSNGMPLAVDATEAPSAPGKGAVTNDFDFWKSPNESDRSGLGCPFGSHIRRMNPRDGVVVGIPQGRRIIRRAMPYGPKDDGSEASRGLVGLFFCADLANQFEFVQHAWANGDVSAPGLEGSVDPFIGTRGEDGRTSFVFDHAREKYTLEVPRLTTIRGSAYLLMPSRTALKWLASAGWKMRSKDGPPSARSPAAIAADAPGSFNVGDPRFAQMPHRFYAHWRKQSVLYVGPPYDAQWVLSYAAVEDALKREAEFVKPGKDRGSPKPSPFAVTAQLEDGLFFQDLTTHKELKACLEPRLYEHVAPQTKVYELARAKAEELLNAAVAKGVFDVVTEYAAPLTTHVFMSLALPKAADPRTDPRALLDIWVRKALMGHSENAPLAERVEGGSATFALRGWLHAFLQGKLDDATVFGAIKGCPAHSDDVLTNTALHFALGGYLSTEFLITTGVYNLLTTGQWSALGEERDLMDSAIEEMLRFDAPFMMADRWIKDETTLAGKTLKAGSNVTLVYGSANRDPEVFAEPDRFDITRFAKNDSESALSHFGFGRGERNCIGQHLARWTASVAFNALLDRFPDARLGEVGAWISDPYYRSLKRLTLTV
jgi:cytochrome P450/deferrochelatase/peroxidase EfeB